MELRLHLLRRAAAEPDWLWGGGAGPPATLNLPGAAGPQPGPQPAQEPEEEKTIHTLEHLPKHKANGIDHASTKFYKNAPMEAKKRLHGLLIKIAKMSH